VPRLLVENRFADGHLANGHLTDTVIWSKVNCSTFSFLCCLRVGQMPVGQMPVGQMSVGKMSVGKVVFDQKTSNRKIKFKSGNFEEKTTLKHSRMPNAECRSLKGHSADIQIHYLEF
jgi:hypothetical protein